MKKSLTFIFAAALLVSCQQEENEATTPANSRITISPIITRATEVNFETGDKIGVTITQNGDFVYAENKQMTYNDGVFAGDLLWYPEWIWSVRFYGSKEIGCTSDYQRYKHELQTHVY